MPTSHRKHADTQRRLCQRFAAPAIDTATCQDITTDHMQDIVNAALTPGKATGPQDDLRPGSAGLDGGYLTNPRLTKVHWQAGDHPLPAARVSVAGESTLWVDPAEVPAALTIARVDQAGRGITVDRKVVEVAGHM